MVTYSWYKGYYINLYTFSILKSVLVWFFFIKHLCWVGHILIFRYSSIFTETNGNCHMETILIWNWQCTYWNILPSSENIQCHKRYRKWLLHLYRSGNDQNRSSLKILTMRNPQFIFFTFTVLILRKRALLCTWRFKPVKDIIMHVETSADVHIVP